MIVFRKYVRKQMEKIVIITGSGISHECGVSTFRDNKSLINKYDIPRICMRGCLEKNYAQTVEFYNERRKEIKDNNPSYTHEVIAKLKKEFPNNIDVVTQNIDDLLEKAGCPDTLHVHGHLPELKCMSCSDIINISHENQDDSNGTCTKCNGKMRPNIVLFGEEGRKYNQMYELLDDCELLILIGTTGNVIDLTSLTQYACYSILNNLEANKSIVEEVFDEVYYEKSTIAIDKIEMNIRTFIETGAI